MLAGSFSFFVVQQLVGVELGGARVKSSFFERNRLRLFHILRKFLRILIRQNRTIQRLPTARLLNRLPLQLRYILIIKLNRATAIIALQIPIPFRWRVNRLLTRHVTRNRPTQPHATLLRPRIPRRRRLLDLLRGARCRLSFAL